MSNGNITLMVPTAGFGTPLNAANVGVGIGLTD